MSFSEIRTANEIPDWHRISSGCSQIDSILGSGIPVNGITEISGYSGAGKTQFCLQLSLVTQLPTSKGGLDRSVVYIATEDIFPAKRLHELAEIWKSYEDVNFEDNIFIQQIDSFKQLKECLFSALPQLLTVRKIGLLVIDSIAGIFRSENLEVDYKQRSQELAILSAKLVNLASKYGFAVVCVNQVADDIATGRTEPCLGLTWSNIVTCRLFMQKCLDCREIKVVFAPDLPNDSCRFWVTKEGLK